MTLSLLLAPWLVRAEQVTSLERISVIQTGSIMSQTESEVVRPVVVIEGEEMEKRRAGTIGEALDGLPGISRSGVALELPVSGEMAIRLDADYRKTDNFSINGFQSSDGEGKRNELLNSDLESRNLAITGVYAGERGFLGIGFSQWNSDYGIPEADAENYARIEAESKRFDLKGDLYDPIPGFNIARISLAYTDYKQDEFEYEDKVKESIPEAVFKQQEFDLRLELTHDPIASWIGVVGLDFNNTKFEADAEGDTFFIRPSERNSIGVFSMQERPTSWGQFELGFRLGYDQFKPEPQANSPVAGNSVTFDNTSIGTVNFDPNPGTQSYLNTGIALGALFDLDSEHKLRAVSAALKPRLARNSCMPLADTVPLAPLKLVTRILKKKPTSILN